MSCGFGGSKSRLVRAVGAEQSGQMRNYKLHAVVARSIFRRQNCRSTTCSELGRLFEVEMFKRSRALQSEAHLEVNALKTLHALSTAAGPNRNRSIFVCCVFLCLFVCLFVRSFVRSFVRLFVCLFVCFSLFLCFFCLFVSLFLFCFVFFVSFVSFLACLFLNNGWNILDCAGVIFWEPE